MAILIDRPLWRWRGQRWSHLVSDHSPDELHHFAGEVGLRRLGYQGDHYDVPEGRFDAVVGAGASIVDTRQLVRRLRAAGLRTRGGLGWTEVLHWVEGDEPWNAAVSGSPASVFADIDHLRAAGLTRVVVLRRTDEWGIGITTAGPPPALGGSTRRWVVHDERGHHTDWFVPIEPRRTAVGSCR